MKTTQVVVDEAQSPGRRLERLVECAARAHAVILDPVRISSAVSAADGKGRESIAPVLRALGLSPPTYIRVPDCRCLPLLAYVDKIGWLMIVGCEPRGRWLAEYGAAIRSITTSVIVADIDLVDACVSIDWASVLNDQ